MESMLVVGIAALVVGLVLGWAAARVTGRRNVRQRRLAQQLDTLQAEHTRYQAQVNEHFMETADLIRQLNDAYRDLHQHLATGAGKLCTESEARHELEQARRDNHLAYQAESEDDGVQPPRDYAPHANSGDRGTLSEDYGLKERAEREERTRS